MLTAIDLETGPVRSDVALDIKPFSPGRLRDPAKIEKAEKEHLGKMALYPTTGEILVVGYGVSNNTYLETRWDFTEQELIQRFWEWWEETMAGNGNNQLVGWNIHKFDMPFLVTRSRIHMIPIPSTVMRGRSWNHRIRDLERHWNSHIYGQYTKFEEACKSLGWGGKPANGAHFSEMFADEPEKAIEYATWDVRHTYLMAERLLGDD